LAASSVTVFPFVIPDAAKTFLAVFTVRRIKKVLETKYVN